MRLPAFSDLPGGNFATIEAFTVRSQDDAHPFLVGQRMDTANIPGGTRPGAVGLACLTPHDSTPGPGADGRKRRF